MSVRYELWRDQVKATERCFWCGEILEGIAPNQGAARAELAKACERHRCREKLERNLDRREVAS